MTRIQLSNGLMVVVAALTLTACTPTVQVAAPKEPITINLNVKIEHEIYVRGQSTR